MKGNSEVVGEELTVHIVETHLGRHTEVPALGIADARVGSYCMIANAQYMVIMAIMSWQRQVKTLTNFVGMISFCGILYDWPTWHGMRYLLSGYLVGQ